MLKRDFMVGYFFHIAIAYRGCTFGIATKAFNLNMIENSELQMHCPNGKQTRSSQMAGGWLMTNE